MTVSFVEAVNVELKRRQPGLVTSIGWKERSAHTKPPCVRWIADRATYGDPLLRDDAVTQPLAGRVLNYKVECWGDTPDATQQLVKSVVRVCHRLGSGVSYSVEGEEWTGLEGSGGAILGELATLTIGIRDDVTDDAETTAEPTTQSPPSGGYA